MRRWSEWNLMPLAASVVVLVYAIGVGLRWWEAAWYELLAALAGIGFAIWFWVADYLRTQRQRRADRSGSDDIQGGE